MKSESAKLSKAYQDTKDMIYDNTFRNLGVSQNFLSTTKHRKKNLLLSTLPILPKRLKVLGVHF